MSGFIQEKFTRLRNMRDTIRDNLLNPNIKFETAVPLVAKYIAELSIAMEHLENENNFRDAAADRKRYLDEVTSQHIDFLQVIVEKNNPYYEQFKENVDYIRLAKYSTDIVKSVEVVESEKSRFKRLMDELSTYLNPFKGERKDFTSDGLYYFYRVLQFLQIVFIPLRFIAFLVKKLFEGLFFVLRHLVFLNAKDDDANLNAFQRVVKEIGIGFDNFLSKNFDALTRPLEAIAGIVQAIGEWIDRQINGKNDGLKKTFFDLLEKFAEHPVRNITEVVLFLATIVVSVVVPLLLAGPALAVVPTVSRHCALPAAIAGMAATHATSAVTAVTVCATVQTAVSLVSEKTEIEKEIIQLEKNLSFYDPVEDKEAYTKISKEIAHLQNKLKYSHDATTKEAHDFEIQETIELLQQNLTFYSDDADSEMRESIQKSIQEQEGQLSMYREIESILHNEGFVWERRFSETSVVNSSTLFSNNSSNDSAQEEAPLLPRSLSMSDFHKL